MPIGFRDSDWYRNRGYTRTFSDSGGWEPPSREYLANQLYRQQQQINKAPTATPTPTPTPTPAPQTPPTPTGGFPQYGYAGPNPGMIDPIRSYDMGNPGSQDMFNQLTRPVSNAMSLPYPTGQAPGLFTANPNVPGGLMGMGMGMGQGMGMQAIRPALAGLQSSGLEDLSTRVPWAL